MTIVTRRFSACPVRTATSTWNAIVEMITVASTEARQELLKIEGIAASIISDETPKKNPITIIGSGSRLRIYCLYDEDGSTEEASEAKLNWNPFDSNWEIYLPVETADLVWVRNALTAKGTRFKAYEQGTTIGMEDNEKSINNSDQDLTIDVSKL